MTVGTDQESVDARPQRGEQRGAAVHRQRVQGPEHRDLHRHVLEVVTVDRRHARVVESRVQRVLDDVCGQPLVGLERADAAKQSTPAAKRHEGCSGVP